VVQKAIKAINPKARYLAGVAFSGRVVILMRDYLWDLIVQQMFKISPQA